ELREPFYVGIGVCAHNADVTEKAVFSNVELTTDLPEATGTPTVYSALETMTLPSTDRRVVLVTPTRIEAPNWLRDGRSLIYNSQGRIHGIAASGGQPEVIDTGFANRCNNDHGVSPDGKLLAISDNSQGRRQSLIYTLPITGGKPTLVTPTGPSYWHGWSPDGRTLAYCADRGGEVDGYAIPLQGGTQARPATPQGADHRQGAGRRSRILPRRPLDLLQLSADRHHADLPNAARRQRAGGVDLRRVQQLVRAPFAGRPDAGLPVLREGRHRTPAQQGRD